MVIGQLQEALSDCNKSLQIEPNDPETLTNRGFVYLKLSRSAMRSLISVQHSRSIRSLQNHFMAVASQIRSRATLQAGTPTSLPQRRTSLISLKRSRAMVSFRHREAERRWPSQAAKVARMKHQ
jgi:hypothetical protein